MMTTISIIISVASLLISGIVICRLSRLDHMIKAKLAELEARRTSRNTFLDEYTPSVLIDPFGNL